MNFSHGSITLEKRSEIQSSKRRRGWSRTYACVDIEDGLNSRLDVVRCWLRQVGDFNGVHSALEGDN
jgi:hypothetical protein